MEQKKEKKGIFKKFTSASVSLMQRWLPDPFIFCAILTFFVFVASLLFTKASVFDVIGYWSGGFWSLLAFSMQMALVLVTGHTMASSPVFKKLLENMASKLKTPRQAIIVVTVVSTIACILNWGFGLVIGAIFAKEIAKKLKGVDYRLLIASAYTGFLVWHGGLSGSIPLQLASGGEALKQQTLGVISEAIPTSQTLFSPMNLYIVIGLLILLPIINVAMYPSHDEVVTVDLALLKEVEPVVIDSKKMTPAEKIENGRLVSYALGLMGYVYIIKYLMENGFALNLNIVNFIFLFTGIIFHGTPRRYLDALAEAIKGAAGILLQFPFYAGIMGIMVGADVDGNSLAGLMSNFFVNISTPRTFPVFTFLSAGIVNFFVPSGGGQWVVQAPIVMPAGQMIGVTAAKSAVAIAWGDAWTNMVQPFWALPALGIAGLGAKDIMGYCLIVTIISGLFICSGFLLF
ncbi:short-chain fatty acid transporter [Fusobacterium gonidiaformans]|uniref:short-chain fatty acid transporter n=1 Tax=Fusobacterium gonidiaformans TaxID=849 RepID=UPI0001BC6528|nr:short-chain fatty acid transporter [Fusobacterium gonidiaformans]AVQ16610.1 short-chain fatty acid transporter [Fusobacterium gonidiaformans ATCC 25563]EFS28183.1 TIGR00366 family protein [Fusobacterium gonidiaformans ATCC 25563]